MANAFNSSIDFLPAKLKKILSGIPNEIKSKTYEIRIRTGKPIVLITSDCTMLADDNGRVTFIFSDDLYKVSREEITDAFNRLCNYSVYSHLHSISQGFITLQTGHRVGICGTAVVENGSVTSIRDINSLNIRIAREFKGCADEILSNVFKNKLKNVIIAGPPSSGKTTLLRDIARQISNGRFGEYYKVSVVDERCEISPVSDGICVCDVGVNTDILSSFSKSDGIMCALRTLSPQLIICDEIGKLDECEAIKSGLNSGVNFVLSIHASSEDELKNKPQILSLTENGFSATAVLLSSVPCKIKSCFQIGECYVKNKCSFNYGSDYNIERAIC